MASFDNTSAHDESQPPTYPSPIYNDPVRVDWPTYLELMAQAIDRLEPGGEPTMFVANYLLGLSKQARLIGAKSPADHLAKAEAAADREAAYIASLEQAAEHGGHWELGPDPDLGDWGGHPDEQTLTAHIAIDPQDETWRN